MPRSFFKRTTFVVGDAEAAMQFYTTVFGLRVWYDNVLEPDADFPPAAPAGSRARLVILEGEDPVIGKLAFLQYLDAPPPAARVIDRQRVREGDTILVFETDDVDAVVARLPGTGATLHAGPKDWEVPSVSGEHRIELRTASLFDPNGIYIEVGTKRAPPPP